MIKPKNKFVFTEEYQWDLLRFTVQDKYGEKALNKYSDDYFTLVEHQVLAYALKTYYKRESKLPGETILRERVLRLLNSKEYASVVTKDEQKDIIELIKPLYHKPVKDGNEIYTMCKDFSNYIRLKSVLENIDIHDYSHYNQFANQVQNAIIDEDEKEELETSFLLGNIKERQFKRQQNSSIFPTPIKQLNALTNAGGYEKASILVLLDKQKKGKTMALVNIARGYLKMKKKILIIDLENGKENYFSRLEQSVMRLTKKEILSGDFDNKVQKRFRKYHRLGGEVVVERMQPLVTTTNDIRSKMDTLYKEYGFRPDVLIIDYAAKMGSISGKDDERSRISDVYLDLDGLAVEYDIEHIWSANHVTREGAKARQKTKYQGEDIALAIDIVRHAQAIIGLNRSPIEEEAGILRMEIVDQRDGQPNGRAVFDVDMATQRMDELNKTSRKTYDDEIFPQIMSGDEDDTKTVTKKKERKSDFSK
ncbi:MAG: hypothetical protein CL596_04915 [Alteromonas sp.]|nr:hypothetical protein [Alteromonas sp.]|tara:strand:+ start:24157 stop:25590 length:1434 start_codon:yes stop_codon:yes gene_type:complete